MQTEPQQKLKVNVKEIIYVEFLLILLITACQGSNTEADIGYGKTFFYKNCTACHNKTEGFRNAPSLLTLKSYDDSVLLKKLYGIKTDSFHNQFFKNVIYSEKEVKSVKEYIKNCFKPHY